MRYIDNDDIHARLHLQGKKFIMTYLGDQEMRVKICEAITDIACWRSLRQLNTIDKKDVLPFFSFFKLLL